MGKPKIRFKGYTEDWEQRKCKEIFDKVGKPVNIKEGELYRELGIRSHGKGLFYKDEINGYELGNKRVFWIEPDCFIVNIVFAWERAVARTTKNEIGMIASHRFPMYKPKIKIVDLDYITKFFTTNKGKYILEMASPGGAGRNKTMGQKEFADSIISLPSYDEQKKIGRLIECLDNLITLHQRKCDETKKLKKCMLQKMFPKEGEKVPEIRFSGFTGDWKQRKFGDMVIIERGGSPRPIDKFITEDENGLSWVKIGDAPEQGNYITRTKEKIKPEGLSKTREVHSGDLILSNSMSFGRPYIMAIDGCIHDGWLLIRDHEKKFDLKYLCCMLGTDMMLFQYKQMAAGSTVNNLNKELVGNTVVKYPSPAEQSKIGVYFSTLDGIITLHKKKCDELRNIKKFMLQNMFI